MLRDFLYIQEKDQFISLFSSTWLTHEEMDYYMSLEAEHRESLPSYSLRELMDIFPTALPAAKRGVIARIKAANQKINSLDEYREIRLKGLQDINIFDRPPYVQDIEDDIASMLAEYEKELKGYNYQLSQLKNLELKRKGKEVKTPANRITDEDVAAARRVPITNFVKVRRDGKAICLFHSERSPSMHVYKDNHFYCFSCQKKGDVLDIVQQQQSLDFHGAIRFVLGKTG